MIANDPQSAISSISVINLETDQFSDSVQEVLQSASGISATMGTKGESNLRIRGFRKNEVLVLLDGIPMTNGYFGNVDISKIPSTDISAITIIKGASSAMFGTNTMGGVVNLITKSQDKNLGFRMSVQRNANYLIELSRAKSIGSSKYSLSASVDQRNGFILSDSFIPTPFENGAVRNHTLQRAYGVNAKYDTSINNLHELGITIGGRFIPYKEIPSSVYSRDYRTYKDWYRAQASAASKLFISQGSELSASIYVDSAGDTYERYHDLQHHFIDVHSRMNNANVGMSIGYQFQVDPNSVLNTGVRIENKQSLRKDNGFYRTWSKSSVSLQNLYLQFETSLGEKIETSGSLGASRYSSSMSAKDHIFVEPSIGLYFKTYRGASSSVSIGKNSSIPTMRQLFSADSGNPNLKPSYAMKYEFSHQQTFKPINSTVSASLYYNDIRNLIDRVGSSYANIYSIKSYGAELSLSILQSEYWNSSFGFAWLNYTSASDYKLSESPPFSFDAVNHVLLPLNTKLTLKSSWRDVRASADDASRYHNLHAYHTHSIELSKKWKRTLFSFELENAFDAYYETEYGFPSAGRDYKMSIRSEL